jgi:hypothetical protein
MTTATVTDRSALASALRDLKLSGMLATLDARLAQADAGELGHLDFAVRGGGPGRRNPLCVRMRRAWAADGRKATERAGRSSSADRPPSFSPLTWHFMMPDRFRHLPRHRTRAGYLVLRRHQ